MFARRTEGEVHTWRHMVTITRCEEVGKEGLESSWRKRDEGRTEPRKFARWSKCEVYTWHMETVMRGHVTQCN